MSDDIEVIKYRAKLKAKLKQDFLKQAWDPKYHAKGEGHVFDPAIQRYMSMKATQYDFFKPTPKTAFRGIVLILPFFIFGYVLKRDRDYWNEQYSTGKVAHKDRFSKFALT